MTKHHNPLNEAMIAQILHLQRHGEIRRLRDLGLDTEMLGLLQSPSSQSVLSNASVSWCQVHIDPEIVKRLLSNRERSENETRLVQRALRLGATSPMIYEFFGMSPQEVALQRVLVGVPGRPGRNRDLPDDTPLWHRFVHLMKENEADHMDAKALLDIAMMLTEELNAPLDQDNVDSQDRITLGLIWNKIQQWLNEGLYPAGPARKPASLVVLRSTQQSKKKNKGRSDPEKPLALDENRGKVEGERM
jgi:hypothetical protein